MKDKTSLETLEQSSSSMTIEDPTADRKILIAVDFGTTFSGVAWAQTRRVRISFSLPAVTTMLILYSLMCSLSSFSGLIRHLEASKG